MENNFSYSGNLVLQVEPLRKEHYPFVKSIYEKGIVTGHATFQTQAPEWDEWDKAHANNCRIIAVNNNCLLGWAVLSPVSGRCVYAGVAEVSVYIDTEERGKGLGKFLLQSLVEESELNGFWTLQAGIFPENKASIAIHQKCGFRIVGYREKIGKMKNTWRDVLLLERRSMNEDIN